MANYVNNRDLFRAIVEYKGRVADAEESGAQRPRVPEYVGEAITLIARRLATKPNFSGYSYKDEMISDGVENCIKYVDNFNPEVSSNPFAYFTMIIKNAFIRRIKREHRQQYFKMRSMQTVNIESILENGTPVCKNLMSTSSEFVHDYERKENKQ